MYTENAIKGQGLVIKTSASSDVCLIAHFFADVLLDS
jgi:hypothetical protein